MKFNLKKYTLFGLTIVTLLFGGCTNVVPQTVPPQINLNTSTPTIVQNNGTMEQWNSGTVLPPKPQPQPQPLPQPQPADPHLVQTYITSTLQINDTAYDVKLQWPSTAYDQLIKASADRYITFHGINYGDLGNMVDEINGTKNSTAIKKYWIYYINGKKAQIGASQYFIQQGDVITWKYEDEE